MQAAVAPRPLEGDELRRRGKRAVPFALPRCAVFLHAAEHVSKAFLGAIGMPVGIEKARAFEQARQHGALGKGEILGGLAEIAARGHLHAPGAAAEISRIEVEFEDLVFAQRGFEPRGHDHFADLAFVGHVLADQEVLHDLLRDGGAALRPARVGEIADEGADDAALVDTVMLEETPVLGGDERLLHQVRNLGERDPDPPIARLEYVGEIAAFAVKHHAHARQLAALEPRLVRADRQPRCYRTRSLGQYRRPAGRRSHSCRTGDKRCSGRRN